MQSIRLITLNIAHGRGLAPYQGFSSEKSIYRQLARIRKLFDFHGPDIICMQEVDEKSHWNRHINLLEQLRDDAHLNYAYLGVHNRREGKKSLAYGNAILSRYPLLNSNVIAFGNRTLGEKGFVYSEVQTPSGQLPIINLHLDYKSRRTRLAQARVLIDFIETTFYSPASPKQLPPLICGDFNSNHQDPDDAVQLLFLHMRQRHEYQVLPPYGRTFPSALPMKSLDFVLLPHSFHCQHAKIIRSYVSDHRPVFVEFTPSRHS